MMKNAADALFVFLFALCFTLAVNLIRKNITVKTPRHVSKWSWEYLAIGGICVLALILLGTGVAHADPPVCAAPPAGAPSFNTPDCTACMFRHVYDSAGMMRECFGDNNVVTR
jgi:hypothetical protein